MILRPFYNAHYGVVRLLVRGDLIAKLGLIILRRSHLLVVLRRRSWLPFFVILVKDGKVIFIFSLLSFLLLLLLFLPSEFLFLCFFDLTLGLFFLSLGGSLFLLISS